MVINSNHSGGFPINSITNSDSSPSDYLDLDSPFDFFQFLKYTTVKLPSKEYNNLFVMYLKEWTIKNGLMIEDSDNVIKTNYLKLLQEITLNYFTIEEKRFVSNVDFDDEFDLDIIIPFYSRKIVEICDFYAKKREYVKFTTLKNSFKGTDNSINRCVYEAITDHLFVDDSRVFSVISENFDIEVEELYDLYQNYFDNDIDGSYEGTTEKRKELYTSNLNPFEIDIFLNIDLAVKKQLFEDLNIFLNSFKNNFKVNYDINAIDLNCKTGDKLFEFITNSKESATRKSILKSEILKKYIGTDYHYLSVGNTNTEFVSGVLFKADNPTANLLNRHFPSTATIEEETELVSIRKIGILFAPEKNSILHFSVPENKMLIDRDKLEAGNVYIFPDPAIYTNAEGKHKYDPNSPLIYIENYQQTIKDQSYGKSFGDIDNTIHTQDFHGYRPSVSVDDATKYGEPSLDSNFLKIFNEGSLYKFNSDINGNLFGLFKSTYNPPVVDISVTLSGYNTTTYTYYGGPIKYTNGFLPELVPPTSANWVYPNIWASQYFYNLMIDAGIGRVLNGISERGTDTYPASFTNTYITSSIQFSEIDGGDFSDGEIYTVDKNLYQKNIFFIREVLSSAQTVADVSDVDIENQGGLYLREATGKMYVKNTNGNIIPLSTALSSSYTKYNSEIKDELNYSVIDFNTYNNFIWIKTSNYLIFEKLVYSNGGYDISDVTENYQTYTQAATGYMISDPFIFENKNYVIFAAIELRNPDGYGFSIVPHIYTVSKETLKIREVYPPLQGVTDEEITNLYKNSTVVNRDWEYYLPVKIKKINSVVISYNTRNDKYVIVAVVEDQNQMGYIFKAVFTFDGVNYNNESVVLSYLEFPTAIKTILFDGYSINQLYPDWSGINTVLGSVGQQIISGGEIKLYAQ